MIVEQKSAFQRTYKKLHPTHRSELDDAIRKVMANPQIGQEKAGDLQGVRVMKCRVAKQQLLLAYEVGEACITLLALGSHENFYRDLKRS